MNNQSTISRKVLSDSQERIWFLQQLCPDAAQSVSLSVRLRGPLNSQALEAAFHDLLERHAILRTAFLNLKGRPTPQTVEGNGFVLETKDLSLLAESERESHRQEVTKSEARKGFDLSHGPLVRGVLLHAAPSEYLLCITAHRLVADRRSLEIFARELAPAYEARCLGKPASLLESPDSALKDDDSQFAYWKERLSGKLPALDLPLDHPRPAILSQREARHDFDLTSELGADAKLLPLLGAFAVLLHRYSGQEDLLIGFPVRSTAVGIGPFENLLPLRLDLSGDPTAKELLQRMRKTVEEALAHQDARFEKIVRALELDRDLSRPPLVQAQFVYEDTAPKAIEAAGLRFEAGRAECSSFGLDLTFIVSEEEKGPRARFQYNSDLFDSQTVCRMAGHFQTILETILKNPELPVSQIPILTAPERQQLIYGWNDTNVDYPKDKCIHELFEAQVERTPDAVALVYENTSLTFSELNARANSLAAHLREHGVKAESRVGVCMARSLEMVVALIAIHKAGGAYVPMDPTYPRERLAFMMEDAQVPVLVTQKDLEDLVPHENAKVLCVESLSLKNDVGNMRSEVTSDNLAYVIYTSGSTGKPKGVMVRHRNAVNFFAGMDGAIGAVRGVWLAVTSISFDISVLELFWTLTRGFKVVVQGDDANSARLAALKSKGQQVGGYSVPEQIARHDITHFQCTPSLAAMLLEDPRNREALKTVRKFFFGGEPLPPSLVERLNGYGEIFNMYGPTETTVWSTVHPVTRSGGTITIGRPIANTAIYILDKNLQPCPIGVPGELYIGGAGVVRGYLNRPDLTAERFVRNPFVSDAEERMYRTGDLAKYRSDGEIDFLGRIDNQVKLRGFRIELGEIEAALRQHPSIKECVVSVWEAGPNDKRLAAYLVAQPGAKPQNIELRRFAKEKLPEYMVPSVFVTLDAMPLTPNGKIDRKALPQPDARRAGSEAAYVPAQSIIEITLAEIFEDLLHVQPIGLNDNFFDFGGTPALALELQARIASELNMQIPIRTLFQAPTAASLAKLLDEAPDLRNIRSRASEQRRAFGFRESSLTPTQLPI